MAKFYGSVRDDTLSPGSQSSGWVTIPDFQVGTTSGADLVFADSGNDFVEASGGDDEVFGEAGDDDLFGDSGDDYVDGGSGLDWVNGDAGDDTLDGGRGADSLYGGLDDDLIYVRDRTDFVREYAGEGHDTVISLIAAYTLTGNVEDLWLGARGWQSGIGNALDNYIDGNDYDNFVNGVNGDDELWGERGDDGILGGNGDDNLYGGNGVDVLRGQVGRDFLAGGLGADTMIGGGGRDIFDWNSASVSPPTARDLVRGGDGAVAFQNPGNAIGDLFDLSGIDANRATSNNDAFIFGGSGVGHLRLDDAGTSTLVRGDIEAGGGWELSYLIEDGVAVLASDYSALDFLL